MRFIGVNIHFFYLSAFIEQKDYSHVLLQIQQ